MWIINYTKVKVISFIIKFCVNRIVVDNNRSKNGVLQFQEFCFKLQLAHGTNNDADLTVKDRIVKERQIY
jgi:hypothetical protein